MTPVERQIVAIEGRCCFCGMGDLERGPRGGASTNMLCMRCGARFNVIDPSYKPVYGEAVALFGQIINEPTRPVTPSPQKAG